MPCAAPFPAALALRPLLSSAASSGTLIALRAWGSCGAFTVLAWREP